jgi:hypothetical protein
MSIPSRKDTQSYAITSLVLAIGSLVIGYCNPGAGLPIAIGAVICGHIAVTKIRYAPDRYTGMGLAIAGLVIGYLYCALLLLLFALAILLGVLNASNIVPEIVNMLIRIHTHTDPGWFYC